MFDINLEDIFKISINPILPIYPSSDGVNKKTCKQNRVISENRILSKNNSFFISEPISVGKGTTEPYRRDYTPIQKYKSTKLRKCPLCGIENFYKICVEHWFKFGQFVPAVSKK